MRIGYNMNTLVSIVKGARDEKETRRGERRHLSDGVALGDNVAPEDYRVFRCRTTCKIIKPVLKT